MVTDSSDAKALLRFQARSYGNGALYALCGLIFHCGVSGSWPFGLVLCTLVIVGLYLGLCLGLQRGWLQPTFVGVVGGCLGVVAIGAFIAWSGGPFSPYIHMFGAMPFMLALFNPGSSRPTLVSGGTALAVLLLMSALWGMPARQLVLQVFCGGVLMALAFTGSRVYRAVLDAQRAAHEARLQALEQLAESERLRGRAERERAEVERLVLMGQLAAGVAHEVNNPLAFVKANLGLLEEEVERADATWDRSELQGLLHETQQGVVRIQQIITDLKDLSRAGYLGEEERGSLEVALREAGRLASVRLGAGGQVELALDAELPAVRLGQRHMVQVLVNLLLNAADAVEQALPTRQAHITVSARRDEGGVRLLVEDNGPGIPSEVLPRLFEAFFTTKPPGKGTGLGLALCREYVAKAGGTLRAENRDAGGARFILWLPLAGAPGAVRA